MTKRVLAAIAVVLGLAGPAGAQMPNIIEPTQPRTGEVIRRAADSHFYVRAEVDGTPVRMVFDTGASTVALRYEDAARIGIDPASLDFSVLTETANGTGRAARVVLPSLTIGGITRRNVAATVHRPGALGISLLGQSFIQRLGEIRSQGNQLMLVDR